MKQPADFKQRGKKASKNKVRYRAAATAQVGTTQYSHSTYLPYKLQLSSTEYRKILCCTSPDIIHKKCRSSPINHVTVLLLLHAQEAREKRKIFTSADTYARTVCTVP